MLAIKNKTTLFLLLLIMTFLLGSCAYLPQVEKITNQFQSDGRPTLAPELAEVEFNVQLKQPISDNETIVLSLLDPLTGVGINPQFYTMVKLSTDSFQAKLMLPKSSITYYKYLIQGSAQNEEVSAFGDQILFRTYFNEDGGVTNDILANWKGNQIPERFGQLRGVITDSETGEPIPDIIVNVAGIQTVSNGLGKFVINGLLDGQALITCYSTNGGFSIFQQAALIQDGMVTEANITLQKTELVNVTFTAKLLNGGQVDQPIRIVGDLTQLGNAISVVGAEMELGPQSAPPMISENINEFSLTLKLPVGASINYKYTQGDGFWNAEKNEQGEFVVRRIVIPAQETEIKDEIIGWSSSEADQAVTIRVKVPEITPSNEVVTIQLNPYDWTAPLAMANEGNNIWRIELFRPLALINTVDFRFCRNFTCEKGVESLPVDGQTRTINFLSEAKNYDLNVTDWNNFRGLQAAPIQENVISTKDEKFISGIDLTGNTSDFSILSGIESAAYLQANTVVIPFRYSFRLDHSTMIEPFDLAFTSFNSSLSQLRYSKSIGKKDLILAKLFDEEKNAELWRNIELTPEFTSHLFDQYDEYLLSAAQLATSAESAGVIIDATNLWPLVPYFGEVDQPELVDRWQKTIGKMRDVYSGPIYFVVNYSNEGLRGMPSFAGQFDGFYIDWTAGLAVDKNTSIEDMSVNAFYMLQNDIIPSIPTGKAILIGLNAPSTVGVEMGCSNNDPINCVLSDSLTLKSALPTIDLSKQAAVYQAMLIAIDQRDDIEGFISRGFEASVLSSDATASIYGKEAFDLLWYWFPKWAGR